MVHLFLIFLFVMSSCAPNSLKEFRKEAEVCCRELTNMLSHAENHEQLLRMEPQLKKQFESLVQLMIAMHQFQQKNLEEDVALFENAESSALQEQLRRVYRMEGGRDIIERAQHEALVTLDAYERVKSRN